MSCRTTAAGSAFTTYARLRHGDGLSDVATLSTFHRLRRDYQENCTRPWMMRNLETQTSNEAYLELLTNQRREIENDTTLTDARRSSLLARIDRAIADPVPDRATIYAIRQIAGSVRGAGRAQDAFLRQYAEDTGVTIDEARTRWNELENGIDRTRGAARPSTVSEENVELARSNGITDEDGSVHAFISMREFANRVVMGRLTTQPRRLIRDTIDAPAAATSNPNMRVVEYGVDERNGYCEFVVEDITTGERTEYAYPSAYRYSHRANGLNPQEISDTWYNLQRQNWSHFRTAADRAAAAVAPRCAMCGQFADNRHACPVAQAAPTRVFAMNGYGNRANQVNTSYQRVRVPYTDQNGNLHTVETKISLPVVTEFRPAARDGQILLQNINEYVYLRSPNSWSDYSNGQVSGDLAIIRAADGTTEFRTNELRCNCDAYRRNSRCEHVDAFVAATRARMVAPTRTPAAQLTPEQRAERTRLAQERAEQVAASDWTRAEATLEEARRTWRDNAEVSYSVDPEAFMRDLEAAQAEIAGKNGAPAVPYMRENALGGMAQRGSGQAFGMEIEYEFPPTMDHSQINAAQQRIGAALHAAGLSASLQQEGYGTSKRRGFKDTHTNADGSSNWSWERDGSVNGGELVTPGMYDEPETWERLEKAVTILRENGAVPSARAGAHVHVGTSMYGGDSRKYAELAKLMTQHEDVMFRLAQEPVRGAHRQGHYTMPMAKAPSGGWRDMSEISRWQGGRTRVLNFGGVDPANPSKDHPEFRIFDSTLDPGVMQSQIKLAVAMTHAAARIADDAPTTRPKEHLGAHLERRKGKRRPMNRQEVIEDAATFRSFMDTLFVRAADKAQLTSLFAATQWNKPDSSNKRMQNHGQI